MMIYNILVLYYLLLEESRAIGRINVQVALALQVVAVYGHTAVELATALWYLKWYRCGRIALPIGR